MIATIVDCKMHFSAEQTIIQFEDFKIELIINLPLRDLSTLNTELSKRKRPFQLVQIEKTTKVLIPSLANFCKHFLSQLDGIEESKPQELMEQFTYNEKEQVDLISSFNNFINNF